MNKLALLLLLLVANITQATDHEEEVRTIRVVSDNWCPYVCSSRDQPGYFIELLRGALNKFSVKVEYVNAEWSKAMEMVQSGQVDTIVGVGADFSNPNTVLTSSYFAISRTGIYSLSSLNWRYSGLKSLDNRKIGFTADYSFFGDLTQYLYAAYIKNPDRIVVTTSADPIKENIQNLLDKKIDCYLDDISVVDYAISQNSSLKKKIALVYEFEDVSPLYIAFYNQKKDIMDLFEKGIELMKSSGQYQELARKYNIKNE